MDEYLVAQIKNTVAAHCKGSNPGAFRSGETNPYPRTEYSKWKLYDDERKRWVNETERKRLIEEVEK